MILFGDKEIAFFDVWSLEHFVMGISISHISSLLGYKIFKANSDPYDVQIVKEDPRNWLIYALLASCFWEIIEFYFESGLIGNDKITFWFQGVEFWGNRIITDQLLVLLGAYIGLKNKKLVIYARVFSILWLILHIFVFPHSMYLHELI